MLVTYIGKKTAYYNNQCYFKGQTFEAPDELPKKDGHGRPLIDEKTGTPITVRLRVYPEAHMSKLRKATAEEEKDYVRRNPDYAKRIASGNVTPQATERPRRKAVTVSAE